MTGRILPTNPANEDDADAAETRRDLVNLQNIAARAIIASRINFYAAEIPYRLKNYISDMVETVNLCENCRTVKRTSQAGYKVFTFRNPYLGNTCVPFLHWACNYNCARSIEIPARREQILSALEQDKKYYDYVTSLDMPTARSNSSSSSTNISLSLSHINLPSATTLPDEVPNSHSCVIL